MVAAVLVGCGSGDSSSSATSPSTSAALESTTTSSDLAATTTTPPSSTVTAPTVPTTIELVDVGTTVIAADIASAGRPLTRTVLYGAPIGSGDDQLYVDPCTECDPPRPWAPLVAENGTIVIADTGRGELIGQPPNTRAEMVDGRLVIVQDGVPTRVALPDGPPLIGTPLLVDELLYVPFATEEPDVGELRVLSLADLRAGIFSIVDTYVISGQPNVRVRVQGSEVVVNDSAVAAVTGSPRPQIEPAFNVTPSTAVVTQSGERRTWEFPPTWSMSDIWALTDGSAASFAFDFTTTPMTYAVQMMPDGTAVAGLVTGEDFSYGGAQIDDRGILQMERSGDTLEVVRYSLPAETTN
jgi:hypothetical protein